jgi:hypothetical protein
MCDRFSRQFAIIITALIIAGIFKAGALVAINSKYAAAGPWMDDAGSIIITILIASGIRSIARNSRRLKWRPVPASLKTILIGYYVLVVAGTISSIVDNAGRPLSLITVNLSAVLLTMFAMANFTLQND